VGVAFFDKDGILCEPRSDEDTVLTQTLKPCLLVVIVEVTGVPVVVPDNVCMCSFLFNLDFTQHHPLPCTEPEVRVLT
jgi:hypothetical protein